MACITCANDPCTCSTHISRARGALEKFAGKHAREVDREMNGTKRSNERPEFELTQKPCMRWFAAQGFSMDRVEARAVFDPTTQRYLDGQTVSGFADAVGCTPDGQAAFCEFKAPGKRSTLQENQREFLTKKILKGSFAVVVDSVACLETTWARYLSVRSNREVSIRFLLGQLPAKPVPRQRAPDADELPF